MSGAVGFGEYEALLPCDALTFSRELFSREYVVQRVDGEALQAVNTSSHWRGLARVNTGHVVVAVDGTAVRGLSWRDFNALWHNGPAKSEAGTLRHVRCRDRRRADLEVEMQKEWMNAGPARFSAMQDEADLQARLDEAHKLIWSHRLTEAHEVLRSLPVGSDAMVCLLATELECVRVLVSNDALYLKQAQRVANQAVTWLQGLYELPSLSYSSHKQMKLALAEALFLLSLLRLGADQRLAAIATARRCAALYAELGETFVTTSKSGIKTLRLLMPEKELQGFQHRVKFGLAVLHVGGSLTLQGSLEWVGALMKETCNPTRGVEYLLECGNASGSGTGRFRANWATLALMHSSGIIRLIRQHELKGEEAASSRLTTEIAACQCAGLLRHPRALLFVWSQAAATSFDMDRLVLLEDELTRISSCEERAHLVRFDVGYRRFLARDFDRSAAQFMPICKCASAPPKLRGLSSIFLAVGYLHGSYPSDAKLLNSVRLLLRSSRRFLALRLEKREEDLEAASLYQRLGTYVSSGDEYLQLLPWEILYVFCYSTRTPPACSSADISLQCFHLTALERLNQLDLTGAKAAKCDHTAELSLLRAIVLFNMHNLDACRNEFQRLWTDLSPSGARARSGSAFSRLLSPRSTSPAAFVAPVAWFYQLRLLLERRSTSPVGNSSDAVTSPTSRPFAGCDDAVQQAPYAYSYIYSGKLQALTKLAARVASDKVDNNGGTLYMKQKSI